MSLLTTFLTSLEGSAIDAPFTWVDPVLSELDLTTNEPPSPNIGDRYINTATGTSNVTGQSVVEHNIYEWSGSSWLTTTVSEGMVTYVDDINIFKFFTGSEWTAIGSTVVHNETMSIQGGNSTERFHLTSAERDNFFRMQSTGLIHITQICRITTNSYISDKTKLFYTRI